MKTDIPLKRLTALRGADILPLLALPLATVGRVDTLELPARARRLDTVLSVESPGGTRYRLVVEWQGYSDPGVLWRLAGYCAWLGEQNPKLPVVGAVIYLTPGADAGDELAQVIDGERVQAWPLRAVRLWEIDANTALESGILGLAVLSPLMANASAASVERAVAQLLSAAPEAQQADLLAILGVFAEPLVPVEQFVQRVGKERLMATDLISYLVGEQLAEREARYVAELQQTLEVTLATRFPQAPLEIALRIRQVTQPEKLHQLIRTAVQAGELAIVEVALAERSVDPTV
jgi:hypothetical protein